MADVNINAAVIESVRHEEQAADVATPAAGFWKTYFKEGGLYWVDDAGVVAGPLGSNFIPSGRLTLTTATPVTTADVTAAATLYYTPYNGNMISLYDGARWIPVIFTEKTLALGALTASKPYDIFGYLSAGTLALEGLVWTDASNRATALAYQNGRLVKSGAATRLYLGTIYINSSGGQTDDSLTKRNVWNYYNRVNRLIFREDTTGHAYTTAAWQYWNNANTNIVEYTCGVVENTMILGFFDTLFSVSSGTANLFMGLDIDAAAANETNYPSLGHTSTNSSAKYSSSAQLLPVLGRHFISIIEFGGANSGFTRYRLSGSILG